MNEKKTLVKLLNLEEVAISEVSIFVERRYLEHGRCGLQGSHSSRYHIHLILSWYDLKDAVPFACAVSFAVVKSLKQV